MNPLYIEYPEFHVVSVKVREPMTRFTGIVWIDHLVNDAFAEGVTVCHINLPETRLERQLLSTKDYLMGGEGHHACGMCVRSYLRHCLVRNLYSPHHSTDANRLRLAIDIHSRFRGGGVP